MRYTSKYWIDGLGLKKHPEGGYFRETYRNSETISDRERSNRFSGRRSLATSIYYLLKSSEVSRFHQINSDELWYYQAGAALTIYCIGRDGKLSVKKLGLDLYKGERPQVLIPAGTIFGAALNGRGTYSLIGCMVSPGFDFADFKIFKRKELLRRYPKYKKIICKLTGEDEERSSPLRPLR